MAQKSEMRSSWKKEGARSPKTSEINFAMKDRKLLKDFKQKSDIT